MLQRAINRVKAVIAGGGLRDGTYLEIDDDIKLYIL